MPDVKGEDSRRS